MAEQIKERLLVRDPGLTIIDGQKPNSVRPGSPLAVIGLFVALIRERFNPAFGLPWPYDADIKKTKIAIESAFNEDDAHRNKRPAIFVDKGESTIGRTAVGDKAGQNLKSGLYAFWALNTIPINIECVAAKKAESMILGDLVQIYLHASSDLVQAKFGLHEMTPVTLGQTQPFDRDKASFITPVSFTIQVPVRWSNKPTTAIINQIVGGIQASNVTNATQFFTSIAIGPSAVK